MAPAGDRLRQQAVEADRLAADAAAVVAHIAALESMFQRVSAEITRLIGGTASADDHRMRQILDSAAHSQRTVADHCRGAAEASKRAARNLEQQADAADREEQQQQQKHQKAR